MTKIEWTQKDIDRFFTKFRKTDGCWIWDAGKTPNGYGNFYVSGRSIGAHVFAFIFYNRYKPEIVRHSCDNPPCVNPHHLLPGDQHENVLDARERRRTPRTSRFTAPTIPLKNTAGEKNGRAKLKIHQVYQIREKYERENRTSLRILASEYGVSKSLIQSIIQGKTWGHV